MKTKQHPQPIKYSRYKVDCKGDLIKPPKFSFEDLVFMVIVGLVWILILVD